MTIEGIEINNLTDYDDSEILSWYEIGKLYFESMGDNPWTITQMERKERKALFIGALMEGGAMIQGVDIYNPCYPTLVPHLYDDNKERAGKIYFSPVINTITIRSYLRRSYPYSY